jgi:hypothetical protein
VCRKPGAPPWCEEGYHGFATASNPLGTIFLFGFQANPWASDSGHPYPPSWTHHFHRALGDGDAYLFWRVSEGGQVEPFKASQSAMIDPQQKAIVKIEQMNQ